MTTSLILVYVKTLIYIPSGLRLEGGKISYFIYNKYTHYKELGSCQLPVALSAAFFIFRNGAYYKKRTEKDLSFHRRPAEASGLRINLIPTDSTSLRKEYIQQASHCQ